MLLCCCCCCSICKWKRKINGNGFYRHFSLAPRKSFSVFVVVVVVCSLCSFQVVICILLYHFSFWFDFVFFFLSNCFVIFYFPWEIVGFADGKGASKIIINFCTQIFGLINCKWNTQKNRPTRAEVAGGRYEMNRNESFQRLVCLLFIVVEILRLVVYLGSYFSIHLLISVLYWWRIYCIYSSVCGCVCETERVLRGLMQNRFEWKWVNRSTTDMKCVGRIFETKFWFR